MKTKSKKSKSAADTYFEQGEAWGQEVYDKAKANEKRAWGIAYLFGGIATLSVLAVAMLTPLKRVETSFIVVDRNTGYMEQITQIGAGTLTQNEALAEANIAGFIKSHEIWDPADFQERVNYVRLTSTDNVYRQFLDTINTRAETLVLDDDRRVYIKTLSHNPERKTAFVRISTDTIVNGRSTEEHWAVTLEYEYTSTPRDRNTAHINPLGFTVTSYRVDQESIKGK